MQKSYFILFSFIILISVLSCKSESKPPQSTENGLPVFEFTSQDSSTVSSLGEAYVKLLNSGNFQEASHMLYVLKNDSVLPLVSQKREALISTLSMVQNFGFALRDLQLYSDKDNVLRIAMLVDENGDLSKDQGVINFILNPIKIDGHWYLTLMDEYADGVGLYH